MSKTLLSAVGATGASASQATATRSSVSISIYSASTSVATVVIEQSVDGVSGWFTVATITNPTSAGELWVGPAAPFTRARVSAWTSGAITAVQDTKLLTGGDPLGQEWRKVNQAAESFGAVSASSMTVADLTTGRVPYASTSGLIKDEAAFAYDESTNVLTVGAVTTGAVTSSALTAGRVPYASTAGLLADEAALAYDAATNTLTAGIHKGGMQPAITAMAVDGAITVSPGVIIATKAGVLAATLAAPTSTTHDGFELTFQAGTANAHTLTTPAGKINSGDSVITLGGAEGDCATLVAYQGIWRTKSLINATLSGS